MFVPLTKNNDKNDRRVLVAGDTVTCFGVLSLLTGSEIDGYLVDAGIQRPMVEFPTVRREGPEVVNVYYDFQDVFEEESFENADLVVTPLEHVRPMADLRKIPVAFLWGTVPWTIGARSCRSWSSSTRNSANDDSIFRGGVMARKDFIPWFSIWNRRDVAKPRVATN